MANGNQFIDIPAPLRRPDIKPFTDEQIAQFQPIETPAAAPAPTDDITSVPGPEIDQVPTPEDDVSSEIATLRSIGQTGDANIMQNNQTDLGIQDTGLSAPVDTPSLLGDAKNFIQGFQALPEEQEQPKTFWEGLADDAFRFNYGDVGYDVQNLEQETRDEFFQGRDADNINNIFDFDTLPPALRGMENNPVQKKRLLENDQFMDLLKKTDPRRKFIYSDVEGTANLAFQIDSLENQLANGEIRSQDEFEEKAMEAFRLGFSQMGGNETPMREDFTLEEASDFLEESLKKIDYVATQRPEDFKPIMQRFSDKAEEFKMEQSSTYQQYLINQATEYDLIMELNNDFQNTIVANRAPDGSFPGGVSAEDVDKATHQFFQEQQREYREIFDAHLQLTEKLLDNRKYLSQEDFDRNSKNLKAAYDYAMSFAKAKNEVTSNQFNFLLSENLTAKEAREKNNEYYQSLGFTRGVESFLNESVAVDVGDFEGFTATGDPNIVTSDEKTINGIIVPWNRYNNILNTISQDISQQAVGNMDSYEQLWNYGSQVVVGGQLNIGSGISNVFKNFRRSWQKGEYQDDFLDSDTLENMSDFLKEKYFKKSSSFATSDMSGVGTVVVNPDKFSRVDNIKEDFFDMGPEFTMAFASMFVGGGVVGAGTKLANAYKFTRANSLLRFFNLGRLSQVATVPTADFIISAGIQESIGGIYRDIDAKVDMMMLGVFDALPTLSKTVGDINFLTMNSKFANAYMGGGKFSLDQLDQAKRVYTDMNNTLYNIIRNDPNRANDLLKKSYVRNKIADLVTKGPVTPQDASDLQAMIRQMKDPNQNVLDMLKFDRVEYVDQKTGRSLVGGMSLGPYNKSAAENRVMGQVSSTKIPDNLRELGIRSIDQKFTSRQAQRVANELGSTVDELFARQSRNAFILKDPKGLGIEDARSISSQIRSNMSRQLIEEDKNIADAFYDAVAQRPGLTSRAANMKGAGVYEQVFDSMKNLLC